MDTSLVDWFVDGQQIKDHDRARWLQLRRHGIGASEAAGVLGVSPYDDMSPLAIYASKLDLTKPAESNYVLAEGLAAEDDLLNIYEAKTKTNIVGRQVFYRHPQFEKNRLFATLDAIDSDGMVVEFKSVRSHRVMRWLDAGSLPIHWFVQVQAQLACSGRNEGMVVARSPETGQVWYRIVCGDSDATAAILSQVAGFWKEHIESRKPPLVRTATDLKLASQLGLCSAATPHIDNLAELADEYTVAKESMSMAEARFEVAKDALCAALQGPGRVELADGRAVEAKLGKTAQLLVSIKGKKGTVS